VDDDDDDDEPWEAGDLLGKVLALVKEVQSSTIQCTKF